MLQATTSFFVDHRLVAKGEIVDNADPIVKGREALFAPVAPTHPVEQATAAPGEKRTATKRVASKG